MRAIYMIYEGNKYCKKVVFSIKYRLEEED